MRMKKQAGIAALAAAGILMAIGGANAQTVQSRATAPSTLNPPTGTISRSKGTRYAVPHSTVPPRPQKTVIRPAATRTTPPRSTHPLHTSPNGAITPVPRSN